MAFKKPQPSASVPDSPDKLFLDLPRRKYTGLIDHQGQILRTYATSALSSSDVALQLPTGSGKTLVGLLIAEWRRRRNGERIVYLCPTKQLVNQVVEEATTKYGLDVQGFTGAIKDYDPGAKAKYMNGDRVAITTYSSLFNTNPFFRDPHVIIVDDAHAAENYIANLWTLKIERFSEKHSTLFLAVAGVLKAVIEPYYYSRLVGDIRSGADLQWVDKLPTPALMKVADELRTVLEVHTPGLDLGYSWQMLRDSLLGCHFYMSATEFLIRPLIPPTWSHAPLNSARQRIFMSATLGAGGDLERLTGRRKIQRLAIPAGWDRQGIGRRLFFFPGFSLEDDQLTQMRVELMKRAGRSLVLVPSEQVRAKIETTVKQEVGFPTFSADDIEATKAPFTSSPNAVAIVANRYDGIDFPGDDCRLLFIEGLPRAVNLQEKFLMSRMGANLLFSDRVQTRVLQAVGRCTRGLNDFSAVVVTGEELADYLVDRDRRKYFHPELQAEISFGIEQSQDTKIVDFLENFDIFIQHGEAWEDANKDVLAKRDSAIQLEHPAMGELAAAVDHEILYQTRMWQGDFVQAFEEARNVLAKLTKSELQGYRALWHYLAGSAALMADSKGEVGFSAMAREQLTRAKEAARGVPWLVSLSQFNTPPSESEVSSATLLRQVERVEATLLSLGKLHNRAFAKREKEILEGLAKPETFEQAQKMLGELLGFVAGKVETDASPDPWWIADDLVFVFEDHAGASSSDPVIDATKARQAASHPDWIRTNLTEAKDAKILPVLVTPAIKAKKGAAPSLSKVAYWHLDEFKSWAHQAVGVVRFVRATLTEAGDLDWRVKTAEAFESKGIDAPTLFKKLSGALASESMQFEE